VPRLESGVIVTSGYLDRDQPACAGYEHDRRRTRDGWAADLFRAK
jgi:hypothetical protein